MAGCRLTQQLHLSGSVSIIRVPVWKQRSSSTCMSHKWLCVCRTFKRLWKQVAQNLDIYRNFPRLAGGQDCSSLSALITPFLIVFKSSLCWLSGSLYLQSAAGRISTSSTRQRTSTVWWWERFALRSSTEVRSARPVRGCTSQTACGLGSKSSCSTSTRASKWATWVPKALF